MEIIEGYLAHKWNTYSSLPIAHPFKSNPPNPLPLIKTAAIFDYESNTTSYSIRVQAKDEFNSTTEQVFTISLTDVYEPSEPNHFVDLNASVDLEMIWVEPGSFTMGSPVGEAGRGTDENETQVTLTQGFYLGKYEVTQAQYEAVMTDNNASLSPTPSTWPGNPNRPVEQVSWDDIQIFLEHLNEQEADNLPPGWAYVLPTEAQWEYACRAGTTTAYSWGDEINASLANYDSNIGQTGNVGSYGANTWGFFDMHGNVKEWTADWYGAYEAGPLTDPTGAASGSDRVSRGGSWINDGTHLRSAKHFNYSPGTRNAVIGFRVGFQYDNKAPMDLNHTAPLVVAENQPIGSIVGDFNATDPDAGATLTYSLISGTGDTDNSLFTLETNGSLQTATTFDYETNSSTYSIRVQAKDEFNATVEGTFTVTLADIYESFTEVSSAVGITVGGSGAWGDFDNDGDVDLFTAAKLFVNDGNGLFTDSSEAFGSGTAIWADVDNDRDLDLYIHANSFGNAQFYLNQGNGWSEQSASMGITIGAEAASWGDYDQDGDLDLFLTRTAGAPTNDVVFRNDNLSFTQVQSGLGLSYSTFGRRSGWVDYDGDGDLDLHALAGHGTDRLYRNTNGSFQNVASSVGLALSSNGNASVWGDLDGDGDLDAFLTFGGSSPSLFRNNNGSFGSFPAEYAISGNSIEGYGSFLDFDCDGDIDLIIPSPSGYDIYQNTGSGFEVKPLPTGKSGQGYSISYADYDKDGDLDLMVSQSSVVLLRNNADPAIGTYLRINPVVGDRLNNAYGAIVRLYSAGNSILGSFMIDVGLGNQDEYGAWFYGLSSNETYEVEVIFPTGTIVRSSAVHPDEHGYSINENGELFSFAVAPGNLHPISSLTIVENQPIGTVVGEFNATDPEGGILTYNLVSGDGDDHNSLFSMDVNGTLRTAALLDYESGSSLSIRIQAKDEYNATIEGIFTVVLSDIYEPSRANHLIDLNDSVSLDMIWVEPGTFTMGSPTRSGKAHG